ncbi:venom carboxylesterase-6-like [Trichoplusia ni]|uniref:Venom carboxylesterase-6-like n=1 Tax=Trichoplusia ni TaxID=7111 RepID=A0A7E5X5M9_TRINI|nr:venom carboxylesterase-6-like [Trichoplusia ni]
MKSLVVVLLIIKCVAGSAVSREGPLVSTPKGQIRGVRAEDGDYDSYLGIPYALVDEEDPFGPSTPHPDFEGTFDAVIGGVECIQASNSPATGIIQCLQLDVFVPNNPQSTALLPVMVYIHGGAFVVGSKAEATPQFLVKHDVILVSINYRLGLYGFLCTSEPEYKNVGLKDQVLALKWIKENIESFGGDPDKITAFGMSAGGTSVDLHLLTSEGLINRAILMSGTALMSWLNFEVNDEMPISLAKHFDYTGNDVKGAIEFLSTVNADEAVTAADRLDYVSDGRGYPKTLPCVETESENAFLTNYPVNMQPKVKGMDIMIGYASKEMMFMYPNADDVQFYRDYSFDFELLFEFDEPHGVNTVRQFYIGDEAPNENLQDEIIDYGSDRAFVHPAERSVTKYLDSEANNVYKYLFSYVGDRNILKIMLGLTAEGACHADDLGYLFDVPLIANVPRTEADQRIIDAMTKMWTDFAKYGNPTPESTELIPEWKPVDKKQRPYLNIDNSISLESRAFNKRIAFWDLYYKLHGDKVRGYEAIEDNEEGGNEEGGNEEDGNEENDDGNNGSTSVIPVAFLSIITLCVTLLM